MRLTPLRVFFPVELDDLGVKLVAVVKLDALPQLDLEGAVIKPPPARRKARHERPVLVELHQVFEDIQGDPDPVVRVVVNDANLATRRRGLLPEPGNTRTDVSDEN